MQPDARPAPTAADDARVAGRLVGVMRGVEGDITEADDAFLAIVGYTRADFEAGRMNWRAMTPREFLHLDEAGIKQAAESGGFTVPYQKEFIRKDGSRVPVLLVCAFVPDDPGTWMGYVVDLSPAEARGSVDVPRAPLGAPLPHDFYARLVSELVRERTRMVAMLDNTDALVWAVDLDFRLLSANHAFQTVQRAVSGRVVEIGDSLMSADYPAERREQWARWYRRALGGERFSVRTPLGLPDGPRHYEHVFSPIVDARQGVVGVTVVSHDVTAHTAAEEALRASEARFRTLIAASPLGIFLADPAGEWIYANPRLAAIWGVPAAELLGRGYVRRVHPDDAARARAGWQPAEAAGDEMETEYRLALPDAAERVVRVRLARTREGGRVTGYVGTVDDDTERRALARRLRQSEQMESLGTLAGGIAHDFNNLLAVVLGYADLAIAAAEGQPALLHDVREIRTAGLRARDLVRQILAFSRRAERPDAPVELGALVAESLRLLRATVPATVAFDVDLPHEAVAVRGDPSALQQVVVNLCANAEYAMRATGGGRLTVRLAAEPPGTGATHAVLAVGDTGPGVPPALRDRLFEPFFTTKPVGEGTGMGLAVVHGIVAAHGGTIAVEPAPTGGALFRVTLPLTGCAGPAGAPPPAPARGSGRVLVVEDEPALARVVERALTRAGYAVARCATGADALGVVRAAPGDVDVVLSDVAMPGMTGDQLALALRDLRPDLPVVLMTGFSHSVTAERAREIGAVALLHKPVSPAELVAAVHDALAPNVPRGTPPSRTAPATHRETAMTDISAATSADSAASGPSLEAQLDHLLGAVEGGGLASVDPAAALGTIDRFRGALAGAADPALAGIATELESLRSLLAGGHAGPELAEALTTLGGKVTALAGAGGPAADRLARLGRALAQGAGQVGRAD